MVKIGNFPSSLGGTVALDANGTRRLPRTTRAGRSNHTTPVDSRRDESAIRRLATSRRLARQLNATVPAQARVRHVRRGAGRGRASRRWEIWRLSVGNSAHGPRIARLWPGRTSCVGNPPPRVPETTRGLCRHDSVAAGRWSVGAYALNGCRIVSRLTWAAGYGARGGDDQGRHTGRR
jgi:hypothetical protein